MAICCLSCATLVIPTGFGTVTAARGRASNTRNRIQLDLLVLTDRHGEGEAVRAPLRTER